MIALSLCQSSTILRPHTRCSHVDAPQLIHLEFYIARSPRAANKKLTCFGNIIDGLGQLLDDLESFRIDYIDGSHCNPRAWLSDCSPASSLAMFPKVHKLVVLQHVFISNNYSGSYIYECDLPSFLPPQLESLTIVCPTELALR